jgi:hypothetical protein
MTKITSVERVLTAFSHKEPDRIPMDLMGTTSFSDLGAYPQPNLNHPKRTEELAEEVKASHEAGDYTISARSATQGIFEVA